MDDLIDSAGTELLAVEDPIEAEMWASSLLDRFDQMALRASLQEMEVPPMVDRLVERCADRGDRAGAVVAAAIAAVAAPPDGELAGRVATDLGRSVGRLPDWVTTVGRVTATAAWVATDPFGDQDSLMVAFRQQRADGDHVDGGRVDGDHVVVTLVDHNLSGQARDAWIATELDGLLASWRASSPEGTRLQPLPVAAALERLRDAMAISDRWNGDGHLRTDRFAHHRALVWARLRRAGLDEQPPDQPALSDHDRAALVDQFLASPHGRHLLASRDGDGADLDLLVHHLVDLRTHDEHRPLRWSPIVVDRLLGDLAPRALLVGPADAAALPDAVRAFARFAADRTGLDPAFLAETLAAVDQVEPDYLRLMGHPGAAGPAKAMLASLQPDGVDLTDLDALPAALAQRFPASPPPAKRGRPTRTAPPDAVEAAARSIVLARFDQLVRFYRDGRKLTQTGQPTLADARHLVAALATNDRLDDQYGGRTIRTRSAADLLELTFTLRWAVAAGALRKEHGKLKATATWRKLDAKPLDRWVRAADALLSLGPLATFHAANRYRGDGEVLDELLPALLHRLAIGPAPYHQLLDLTCHLADATFQWVAGWMHDPDHRRTSFGWDLDRLADILGWAALVDRTGATTEPDDYGTGTHLAGGTLSLTPVATWWLGPT